MENTIFVNGTKMPLIPPASGKSTCNKRFGEKQICSPLFYSAMYYSR